MPALRIPLFPLELVLFPGNTLPLHIFEPRYQTMIRRSIDEASPFGITLAREHGLLRTGCTAEVARVLQRHDDGRMDIETVGRSAFRLIELHQENPLLESTIEILEDDPSPGPPEIAARLRDLYRQCCNLLADETFPEPDALSPDASLSYSIAHPLPLELEEKQELLEIRSEAARRARLVEHLREFLTRIEQIRRGQSKAAGNGHSPS